MRPVEIWPPILFGSEVSLARVRDPFGLAVSALKARLRTGAYGLGRPLLISEVAEELGLSTTPVREAMARLVGEGLIEEHRGRGYMTWRLDAADLTELYELEGLYIAWSLDLCAARGVAPQSLNAWRSAEVMSLPQRLHSGLMTLVAAPGHGALYLAYQRTAEQLGPARQVEGLILQQAVDEYEALVDGLERGAFGELSVWAQGFSQSRLERVVEIASSLRRGSVSLGNI